MDDLPNHGGNSRRWIMQEVDNSLRRLQTDWIDLYQIHRPDPTTDIRETVSALTDLVRAGKIRAFGLSTYQPSQIVEAQWVAKENNFERFVTEQPPYSMLIRSIESDILPTIQRYKMGALVWSPLAGGWLSGKHRKASGQPKSNSDFRASRFDMSKPGSDAKFDATEALAALADEHDISLIHMAIVFTIRHPAVPSAIIGPRTMEQLESLFGLPACN
jgi:aryl-alcohol dehydrogenase-like predicted oxidoreductase